MIASPLPKLYLRNGARIALFGAALVGLSILCAQTAKPPQQGLQNSQVPFVGCQSDGQLGPEPAPSGNAKLMNISAETAQRLSLYQSSWSPGVLAHGVGIVSEATAQAERLCTSAQRQSAARICFRFRCIASQGLWCRLPSSMAAHPAGGALPRQSPEFFPRTRNLRWM